MYVYSDERVLNYDLLNQNTDWNLYINDVLGAECIRYHLCHKLRSTPHSRLRLNLDNVHCRCFEL